MENTLAFAMGEANRHKELMVFDWDKAARLIKEKGAQEASAGLFGDWEWTGGDILTEGKPNLDDYTFLASTWATPELEIDGEKIPCFIYQNDNCKWDSGTKWPESSLKLLNG